jgi:uncharacterized cupredoxin-like copper-binding protein
MLLILVLLVACSTDDASEVKNVADTGGHRSVPGEPAPPGGQIEGLRSALCTHFNPSGEDSGRASRDRYFVITNEGNNDHEFVLGDRAYQVDHEQRMSEYGANHGEMVTGEPPNVVDVAQGETKRLTWSFNEPGEVLFGCHSRGQCDGSMVGEITIG